MRSHRRCAMARRGARRQPWALDASVSDSVISVAPARARGLVQRRALLAGTMLAGVVLLTALAAAPARADGGAGGAAFIGTAGGAGGTGFNGTAGSVGSCAAESGGGGGGGAGGGGRRGGGCFYSPLLPSSGPARWPRRPAGPPPRPPPT